MFFIRESKGATIVATPDSFPESVLARIRKLAESHPEAEVEIGGGLAALLNDLKTSGGNPIRDDFSRRQIIVIRSKRRLR